MANATFSAGSRDVPRRWLYGCVLFAVLLPVLLWVGVYHLTRGTQETVAAVCKAIVSGDKGAYTALFVPSGRARAEESWEILRATEGVLGHIRGCTVQHQGVKVSLGTIKPTATFTVEGSRGSAQIGATLARSDGVWQVENVQLCFR